MPLKQGITLGLGLNAFNLLNSQRPVSYVKDDNSLFGETWARQLPRWLQLKVMLRFYPDTSFLPIFRLTLLLDVVNLESSAQLGPGL